VTWLLRDPERWGKDCALEDWAAETLTLTVDGYDDELQREVAWFIEDLDEGDEVTIRIMPGGEDDPPGEPVAPYKSYSRLKELVATLSHQPDELHDIDSPGMAAFLSILDQHRREFPGTVTKLRPDGALRTQEMHDRAMVLQKQIDRIYSPFG
jgi:hypothetical protein